MIGSAFVLCDRPEGDHLNTKQVQGATRPPVEAGLWGGSSAGSRDPLGHLSEEELNSLSFTELRDKLLAFDPLNKTHVTKVRKSYCPLFDIVVLTEYLVLWQWKDGMILLRQGTTKCYYFFMMQSMP